MSVGELKTPHPGHKLTLCVLPTTFSHVFTICEVYQTSKISLARHRTSRSRTRRPNDPEQDQSIFQVLVKGGR